MKKKPPPNDSRFQPIVDFYCMESQKRYGGYLWDAADGRCLGRLLHNQPQIPLASMINIVRTAFDWADSGDFCPLLRGFRFAEFCRHFIKVAVRANLGAARKKPTAEQVRRVFKEFSDRVIGGADPRAFWDRIIARELGVSYDEAKAILDHEPMWTARTGD